MTTPDNINFINFNMDIGKKKPHTINGEDMGCPFCDVEHLTNIIETQDDMILLKNKYNVLENATQLVLIESDICHTDMPEYTPEKMHRLIRFGLRHWLSIWESGKYKSAIFFKNFGPLSGGTIQHPHMQIIAFPQTDPSPFYNQREFEGILVQGENQVEINMSTRPRIGFFEINVLVKERISSSQLAAENYEETSTSAVIATLAHYLQTSIRYFYDILQRPNLSYNIFFYLQDGYIRAKIMPRFATSPLYIGYNIHLIPTNIKDFAAKLREYLQCVKPQI